MEALSVAKVLVSEFICRFGVPDSIHTDQGKNFEAKVIQEICHLLGVTKARTTPYHPQSDGLVERFNRTLLEMLSTTVADEHDWDLSLPTILLAYRTNARKLLEPHHFSSCLGTTPVSLRTFCIHYPLHHMIQLPKFSRAVFKDLTRLCLSMFSKNRPVKDVYDRGVRGNPYGVDDLVLLHSPAVPRGKSQKLHKPWQGPYRVVKAISPSVYRIVDCA